jgi:hypothetical protein
MAVTQDISTPVRSEPLINGKPVTRQAKPRNGGTWALALALIAFGSIGWVLGGMFTFDGWITWVNGLLTIVRLPLAIPPAAGLLRLLFIPLAIAYSRVEVKHRPVWRDKQGVFHFEPPLFWVGFLLITLTDIGSTAVGIQSTNVDEWGTLQPLVMWVTQAGARVGSIATILTFAPEWLIMGGIWLLKR